jgi:hypothetical protein
MDQVQPHNQVLKGQQGQNKSKNRKGNWREKKPETVQNEEHTKLCPVCPLCKDNNVEISMPCAGMHSYCFSCIKKWLVSKKELSCPECRKTCEDIIKIPNDKEKLSAEFQSFLESVKIIPNPLKHDEDCKCFQNYFENTCIYPNWSLIHFVENKEQLELYYESLENPKYKDKTDDLTKLIKWHIYDEEDKAHRRHNHAGHNHS